MIEFFEDTYRPLRLVGCTAGTLEQYRLSLARWAEFAGAVAIDQVGDELLGQFAQWRLGQGVAAATVNKDLRQLMPIVRLAAERGVIPAVPKIKMLPEDIDAPRAFLLDEVSAILAAATKVSGSIDGLPASDWWFSLLLVVYDTGGRIGAVLAVSPAEVDLAGATLHLRAATQKQHRGQVLALHEQAVEACRAIWVADRPRMWPWPHVRNTLYERFRAILRAAEVETWHATGSLFHRLRKSTASYLQAAGGDPVYQMGHSSASVTARYLDPRICRARAAELIPRPTLEQ